MRAARAASSVGGMPKGAKVAQRDLGNVHLVAVASLLLRCCFAVASLLLRCCFAVASLLLRCCFAVASLLLRCCFVVASLLLLAGRCLLGTPRVRRGLRLKTSRASYETRVWKERTLVSVCVCACVFWVASTHEKEADDKAKHCAIQKEQFRKGRPWRALTVLLLRAAVVAPKSAGNPAGVRKIQYSSTVRNISRTLLQNVCHTVWKVTDHRMTTDYTLIYLQ
jgi:hypothetical protein